MAKSKRKKRREAYQTEAVFSALDQSITRSERFIEKYQKALIGVFGALILGAFGYYGYQNMYVKPREKEATDEIFHAVQYLERDSLDYALQGDGQNYGLVAIVDTYSGTRAANLARFYAGVAYLKKSKYEEAIEYLDAFSSGDELVAAQAKGLIGDAFMELDQFDVAREYYERAAEMRKNAFTTPMYLKKAAMACIAQKDWKSVAPYFKEIKETYPKSTEAAEADKYIARSLAVQKN